MRQVFSSPRLENVEAVAAMLRAEGIEIRISDGRSYHGNRRSNFSYAESGKSGPQPAIWIINAEDQPRARQMLRDAGLLESTRVGESSYLPLSSLHETKDPVARKAKTRTRMRIGLLVLIVLVSALVWYSRRQVPAAEATQQVVAAKPEAPKHAAPAIIPQQADELEIYRADVPSALAKLLIESEIAKARPAQACITIDAADPSPQFLESLLHAAATTVFAASDCPIDATWKLSVRDYMTDGLGRGHVQLESGGSKPRTIEAERDGVLWKILSQR